MSSDTVTHVVSKSVAVVGRISQLTSSRLTQLDGVINDALVFRVKYIDHQVDLQSLRTLCTQHACSARYKYLTLPYLRGGWTGISCPALRLYLFGPVRIPDVTAGHTQ